ncbi:hypothetical protein FIBSPDRAFT_958918 [Athelia psychrophila]|uniref:Uncharacterized protein n=1 Tax=Athelia psychrophila TaxID=1759441 RepID=A0A166E5F2_9AGAM|nr:hypothetical protein FIBSPDRAFT_958918 [Fibularhizoctonia sp. CBS 109695]
MAKTRGPLTKLRCKQYVMLNILLLLCPSPTPRKSTCNFWGFVFTKALVQADHPGQPPSSPPKIHYQHLTGRGKGSTFLKVTPRAVPTSTDILEDMIADLRKAANSAGGDPASKLNARQINPWMLTTKWYLHVEGADPLALKEFVAPNKEIAVIVKSYFAEATKLLSSTEELVRQKINSPDHIKLGVNNTPFHKHEQPETLPIYCGVVTSLLNLLLEDKEHYEKILCQDTVIALNVFESVLEGSMTTGQDASTELHNLLLQLWHREWATPSEESDIPDPTIRTLALRSLLADGSFKEPSAVAPDIAKFEHLMRLTSVREIHNLAALKYNGNQLKAANDVLPWLQEKVSSTFNSLRSLQHRATSIVYSTPSLPNAWWIDRENWTHLLYKGYPVKMEHISEVFNKLEQQSMTQFEEKVLLKQKIRVRLG